MLTVNDLMTVHPMTIQATTPLSDIRTLMSEELVRQLPVLQDGKVVGIVTERDLRSADLTPIPVDITADAIMTRNPFTVAPETPAYRAAEMLRIYKIGALPVVTDGVLVGIISVSDFLDQFVVTAESVFA